MTPTSPLIPTKLEPPRVRKGFVERPALVERLAQGLDCRLTLVSAPAGYGKSTLVARWLDGESAPPSAWVSLERMDGDLQRFSRYLVAAVRAHHPGAVAETDALLYAQTMPSPEYLAETLAAELAGLDDRMVVVLDDYGLIRAEAVHAMIRGLVRKLPDTLHLVLITRVDPPFPLGLWRTRGWLNELRGIDLRFSLEEVQALFYGVGGPGLSRTAIQTLHEKTEGWVAGLRLAELSLSGATDPEDRVRAFSGSNRLIVDYLMEEVLGSQPPEIRELLAATAPLSRFCAPLCDNLLSTDSHRRDTRPLLDQLYRSNVFVFPLGGLEGWYRYHHLFRQLLLDRIAAPAPELRRDEVLKRAGKWFQREGWTEESLQLLVEAGDLDGAADLVGEHLHEVIRRDLSRRTLIRWLDLFPAGADRGRLPLVVASLYRLILPWDFEGMLRLLDLAGETGRDPESDLHRKWEQSLQPDLDVLRGYALYWSGDINGALAHTARALISNPDHTSYQHSLAVMYYGGTLACTGQRSELQSFLDKGLVREQAIGGPQVGPYLVLKSVVHFYQGQLEECRRAASRILSADASVAIPGYWLGIGHYFMGAVAYEWNHLEEAEAHFREGLAMRYDMSPMFYHHLVVGLGRVGLARGDKEAAEHWAAAARDFALEMSSPSALRSSEWFLRQVRGSEETGGSAGLPAPTNPDFMWLSLEAPSQSWACLRLLDSSPEGWEEALRLIDEARERAETHFIERQGIQLSVLRAAALHRLGRPADALESLEHAVRRGEPLGFVRSFLDRSAMVGSLLSELAERDQDGSYAVKLLQPRRDQYGSENSILSGSGGPGPREATASAKEHHPTVGGRGRSSADELTDREIEVLELLQQRLSNKEIAGKLFVTSETVRKHAGNLYRKLGVSSRRQAVAEAVARGLLDPGQR